MAESAPGFTISAEISSAPGSVIPNATSGANVTTSTGMMLVFEQQIAFADADYLNNKDGSSGILNGLKFCEASAMSQIDCDDSNGLAVGISDAMILDGGPEYDQPGHILFLWAKQDTDTGLQPNTWYMPQINTDWLMYFKGLNPDLNEAGATAIELQTRFYVVEDSEGAEPTLLHRYPTELMGLNHEDEFQMFFDRSVILSATKEISYKIVGGPEEKRTYSEAPVLDAPSSNQNSACRSDKGSRINLVCFPVPLNPVTGLHSWVTGQLFEAEIEADTIYSMAIASGQRKIQNFMIKQQ